MKKVKDVVNRNLITVSPSSSFEEVINIMKKGVGKVPVLENEKVVAVSYTHLTLPTIRLV